jgi:hypothetical protein
MAFYDIQNVSYKALIEHAKTAKEYRDSGGAYNLGARRYSDRHFRLRGDLIDIYYTHPDQSKKIVEKDKSLDTWSYHRHLLTIHPDNSFEVVNFSGQGDNMFMSQAVRGYIHQDGGRKGVVYYTNTKMHPIFKGLRIDLETGDAVTPYKFYKRDINKKKANETLKEFAEFQTMAMKFVDPMTPQGILEVFKDLYDQEGSLDALDEGLFVQLVRDKKYVDAAIVFSIAGKGIMYHSYRHLLLNVFKNEDHERDLRMLTRAFDNEFKSILARGINEAIRDIVLIGCDDAAILKELPIGEKFPSSKWGYNITDQCDNRFIRI